MSEQPNEVLLRDGGESSVVKYMALISTEISTSENARDDNGDKTIDQYLWMYFAPIIFILGMAGNILTIIVMRRARFRGITTAVYLPLIAVADTAVLITGIPEWLAACEFVVFKEINQWTCKWEKFLFYTSGDTAIWILCAFTFDRFIAVCFPFKKRKVCQPKRALIICIVLFVCAISKNLHVFWTRGPEYDEEKDSWTICGKPEPHTYFEKFIRPWIAFALVSIIPFCLILTCNIFIIRQLLRAQRMRHQQSNSDKGFMQTTVLCLGASASFLICITPSIVLLIGKPYWTDNGEGNDAYDIAKSVSNQLVFVNHSINFWLYCVMGKNFRRELVALMRCSKGVGSPTTTKVTTKSHVGGKTPPISSENKLNGDPQIKHPMLANEIADDLSSTRL